VMNDVAALAEGTPSEADTRSRRGGAYPR
jgi:hypothetical protein